MAMDNNQSESKSGELFADLVGDTDDTRNVFDLDIFIGGQGKKPSVQFSLPTAHLDIPSISLEDLLTLDIGFHAQPSDGDIDNDKTIDILKKMSINFASSGCDIVAPSDMMDGRVKIIREELESNNFYETSILSYSSKFCSNFYSPFRDALGSQNSLGKSDKKTYQIDFRNRREAIKESLEDVQEGADILMVKPAGYYLDIIREIKNITLVPISAFQVSGEYSMIKYASEQELIDYEKCVIESLFCIKRAGADLIFSYFSSEVAKWLKS